MSGIKIKVLFRHRSMEMGGVEKVLLSMLHNLDREKFDISLCLNLHQGELRDTIPKFIPTKILAKGKEDFPKNKYLNKFFLILRGIKLALFRAFPWIVDRYILKNDADVEIATGYTMFGDVLNSSNKNSKKIGWLHSDLTVEGFAPYREKIFNQLKQFDYIIYGSQQSKDVLMQKYPDLDLPPGEVVLNAIFKSELEEKARYENIDLGDKPSFISVSRLHYRKGQRVLLEAHKKLIDRGFEHNVYLIGDGEDYELLKKRAKELDVDKTFHLLGTKMNPYPYVAKADYFIMPSETEGWPLIIAEALLLEKPIISTNVGGIPEMITHLKNGYLISYDAQEMSEAMQAFLQNKKMVEEIKKNLKDSEKQFDNQKIFDSIDKIITNLV